MKRIVLHLIAIVVLAVPSPAQTQSPLARRSGMYVEAPGGLTKIIGQIAEFKRSGSSFVSHATVRG